MSRCNAAADYLGSIRSADRLLIFASAFFCSFFLFVIVVVCSPSRLYRKCDLIILSAVIWYAKMCMENSTAAAILI